MNYGYWGMLIAAFLAGSFFPFSSEVVMLGLLAAGLDPWPLIGYGTVGNVAGSLFNYGVGRMGKLEWMEEHLHVKRETLQKAERFMGGHGALMGFFAFIPFLGSAITIALGYTRANLLLSATSITIGKFLRYVILVYGALGAAGGFSLLTSCQRPQTEETITVTIEPLAWFVDEIAEGSLPVQSMVPAGANAETYEPTPRQMMELAHSPIYIKVGCIGFETTWAKKLQANAPKTRFIDSSQDIRYIESSDGIKDPHTWMSTTNARLIARNIHHALVEQYPDRKADFDQGLQRLLTKIDTLDTAIRQTIRSSRQKSFVVYHPALTYFARDYQLLQLPMEEEGREPNAASIQHLIEQAKAAGVRTVFVQKEFSPRNTVAIRNATGATSVEINPLTRAWDKEMLHIANSLR